MSGNLIVRLSRIDPTYESYQGEVYCFFCGAWDKLDGKIKHEEDCLWLEAVEQAKQQEEMKGDKIPK